MSLRERAKADLPKAIKARQRHAVVALRSILAAIDNAEAVEPLSGPVPLVGRSDDVPRKELSETQIREIVRMEADERRSAVAAYERLGQQAEAARLRAEIAVIDSYLNGADPD